MRQMVCSISRLAWAGPCAKQAGRAAGRMEEKTSLWPHRGRACRSRRHTPREAGVKGNRFLSVFRWAGHRVRQVDECASEFERCRIMRWRGASQQAGFGIWATVTRCSSGQAARGSGEGRTGGWDGGRVAQGGTGFCFARMGGCRQRVARHGDDAAGGREFRAGARERGDWEGGKGELSEPAVRRFGGLSKFCVAVPLKEAVLF
jgi:hypothetical protein